MANHIESSNVDHNNSHSTVPTPLPPPPSSVSRRSSSSTSFARCSPDRIVAEVDTEGLNNAHLHATHLVTSPGSSSNYSTETTTTIDIPEQLDITHTTSSRMDSAPTNSDGYPTSNGSCTDPPLYANMGSTAPVHPPPPVYYLGELPPAYQVAAALPTYEEAELTKGNFLSL